MTAYFESHRAGDGISVERRYIVITGVREGLIYGDAFTRAAGSRGPRR